MRSLNLGLFTQQICAILILCDGCQGEVHLAKMRLGMYMLGDEPRNETISGIRRRSLYPVNEKGLENSEALISLQEETRASYERHLYRSHTQASKSIKGTNNIV